MKLDKKEFQDLKENNFQIEAGSAVPVVKGEAFTNAARYEVTPYKVRVFFGFDSEETVKEFDIKDVIFSGWSADFNPKDYIQEG